MTVDQMGNLWLGTPSGVYRYEPKGKSFTNFNDMLGLTKTVAYDNHVFAADNDVIDITEDKNGTLWFLLDQRIIRYDGKNHSEFEFVY